MSHIPLLVQFRVPILLRWYSKWADVLNRDLFVLIRPTQVRKCSRGRHQPGEKHVYVTPARAGRNLVIDMDCSVSSMASDEIVFIRKISNTPPLLQGAMGVYTATITCPKRYYGEILHRTLIDMETGLGNQLCFRFNSGLA